MDDHDPERPSKSQRKRDMQALQDLGERLVKLGSAQLAAIEMPQNLRDAVNMARTIDARGGRKRQLQYIGKLMRNLDAEPIQRALAKIDGNDHVERALLHQAERWRERLLAEGDAALEELFDQHPESDRQHLRRLVRDARQELETERPPRHQRELFRAIRSLLEAKT